MMDISKRTFRNLNIFYKIGKNYFFIYLFTMLKLSIYIKNKLMQGMTFSKSMLRIFYIHFIAFEKKCYIFLFLLDI